MERHPQCAYQITFSEVQDPRISEVYITDFRHAIHAEKKHQTTVNFKYNEFMLTA